MAQYEPFDPEVEVRGQVILAVCDRALARFSADHRDRALDALAEEGVVEPAPEDWYPQQTWLNAFEAAAEELEPHVLDRLGEQIPAVAEWPDGIDSVEDGLRSIDEAYQQNHRGGEIGAYQFEQVGEQSAEITCRNPYPCEFDRGLIRAVARKYAPVESFVFVEETGDDCRREGADACTYTVHW